VSALSLDGATVYVANWFSNELWAIDAVTLKVRAENRDLGTDRGPLDLVLLRLLL